MSTADKLTYLNDTKGLIKDSINLGGGNLTTEPFRQYATTLKNIYKDFFANGIGTLWNNWEKVTGTGTSLSLSPTIQGEMEFTYKGNTSQNGTPTPSSPIPINVVSGDNEINICGKNLLDLTSFTTLTQSGITLTPTFDGSELLYITSSGTFSSITYMLLINTLTIQPNTTYTLSGGYSASARLRLREYDSSNTQLSEYFDSGRGVSFTSKSNVHHVNIQVVFYAQNNVKFYPMLEKGSTSTTYEPYIGNTYPIYLGVENLIPTSDIISTSGTLSNGVTFTRNSDGSITANGTATGAISIYINNDYTELSAGTYTFSDSVASGESGTTFFLYADVRHTDDTGWDAYNFSTANTTTGMTQTIPGAFKFKTRIVIRSGQTLNNVVFKPQLEKGSKANSYSAYGTTPIELCKIGTYQDKIYKGVGYNLFDKDNVRVGYRFGSDGDYYQNAGYNATEYISVKPNTTYSTSWTMVWDEVVCTYDINHTFIRRLQSGTNFTTSASEYYIRADVSNAHLPNAQINEGSTALPYEPYNAKDKWYLHKEIGKVVLDGSENWAKYSGTKRYYLQMEDILTPSTNNEKALIKSNLFTVQTANYTSGATTVDAIALQNDGILLVRYVAYNDETLANFKTWLSTNNITLHYVLATPTNTLIEDTTLINQLEESKLSYISQTNISQVNNDLPFNLDVKALKNI